MHRLQWWPYFIRYPAQWLSCCVTTDTAFAPVLESSRAAGRTTWWESSHVISIKGHTVYHWVFAMLYILCLRWNQIGEEQHRKQKKKKSIWPERADILWRFWTMVAAKTTPAETLRSWKSTRNCFFFEALYSFMPPSSLFQWYAVSVCLQPLPVSVAYLRLNQYSNC